MKASFNPGRPLFLALLFAFAFVAANSYAATDPGACTVEDLFTDIAATENCLITKEETNNPANEAAQTCGKYTADPQNQPQAPGAGTTPFMTLKLFSAVICRIVQLTRDIAGTMWCGISNALVQPLELLITLYITVLGIMFTIGTLPPRANQLMLQILKVALVWALATDGALAIQYGYNFFMTVATDGISIVITNSKEGGDAVTPGTILDSLDEMFTAVFFSNAPLESSKEMMSVFASYAAISSAVPLGVTLGMFLMLTVFYSLFVFLKAIMSYLFAITGITFLTAMMPIFLCFALFRTTSNIFWGWLGALVSFTIQPIILFAFLILVQSHLRDALDDIACLIQTRVAVDKDGKYNSDGSIISLLDPHKYHLTQDKCFLDSDPNSPECQSIKPYEQWDNSLEFLNDTTIPIISALILLVLTNYFLGWLPEIAQTLSSGLGAAPALGGSAYSGGGYYVRHGIFDSVDRFMSSFNATAGQNKTNTGFLRNPLISAANPNIPGSKDVYDTEKLEVNYQAFGNQLLFDASNVDRSLGRTGYMYDLGLNRFSSDYRAGKEIFTDRSNVTASGQIVAGGADD